MSTATSVAIQPAADRLVVRPLSEPEKTTGGLYIPDVAKEKPQQGEVVAVGPGRVTDAGQRIPPEFAVGARVLFGKFSGTEVEVEGERLLILRESDILATLLRGATPDPFAEYRAEFGDT